MSRRRGWWALVCCLAGVATIAIVTTDREVSVPVSYADVAVGQTGSSTDFDAQVLDVRVTQAVLRDEYSEPLTTDARFVVVDLTADARTDDMTFNGDVWLLNTTGDRYGPRPEFSGGYPPSIEPGFTATGTYVFQVPADRLDGARLLVEPPTPLFLTYDVTVRIDLGLTDQTPLVAEPVMLASPSKEATP